MRREQWRVTVTREVIHDVEGIGDETEYVTEFEAVARTPEQLARFAPQEVLAALGGEHLAAELTPVSPDGPETATASEPEQPKRRRRTKAEIAADEAAAKPAGLGPETTAEPAPAPERPEAPAGHEVAPVAAAATPPTAPYNPFAQ